MSNSDTVRHLIKLFEGMQVDEFLTYLTDDALYRFGNYPPAIGKENVEATVKASHLDQIKGVAFNILEIWEVDDSVICEMDIVYTKVDDSTLTLPCTDIFKMQGGKVKEMKVYMDASPLFS